MSESWLEERYAGMGCAAVARDALDRWEVNSEYGELLDALRWIAAHGGAA